ncbi:peptidoglycan-binding protein [Nocardia sp. XZ_19_231]|uniref:peptidoglycan-binding domain-containing protein n=1 Tax=Nocardia sp. XZ_19_231 TaxID=2769252 RepID=UPI00188EE04F|nr:peptidoglycan-binding domain-containing protein [Nocardia sp. XZ_19_231]
MTAVLRPGDRGDLVGVLQATLNRDYPLYSRLVVDGEYGPATTTAVAEFQRRAGLDVAEPGTADTTTLHRLGLNFDKLPPPPGTRPFYFSFAGTWGHWNQGPQFDVGSALEGERRVRNQPVAYPASGFLNPDPHTSYKESVALGVVEGMRLILMNSGPFILAGYSQGAEVAVRLMMFMIDGGPLEHRADDLRRVITFGSPCRPPGRTLLGNNPQGAGISGDYTPQEFRDRTFDFVLDGDMYAMTTRETLLEQFYDLLVQAELSVPFAVAVLQLMQSNILGGGLGGPFGAVGRMAAPTALTRLGDVDFVTSVRTMQVVSEFLIRNPHIHYHDWPDFNGQTGIERAKQVLRDITSPD